MKKILVVFLAGFLALALLGQVYAATYVSRNVVSAGGLCAAGFEPDNVKQIVSRYLNATGTDAADKINLWKSSTRTNTDQAPTAPAAPYVCNYVGFPDLYVTATTNFTSGDWLFIYIVSGADAGKYQIVKCSATISAGVGCVLSANLTYSLPYGTYVYVMDASLGTILVGNATKELSNAGGWLAAPTASPLILDFVGPATLSATAINSVFCVYQ